LLRLLSHQAANASQCIHMLHTKVPALCCDYDCVNYFY